MFQVKNYLENAKKYEAVFRNILKDMQVNEKLPLRGLIPTNLETEAPLEKIVDTLSAGNRNGQFTITDFGVLLGAVAVISWKNVASLSGGGAELKYLVKKDSSVEYIENGMVFRS